MEKIRTKLLIGQIKKKFAGQKISTSIYKIVPETMGNVLIVIPHPDDEVIGCGGMIQELVNRNTHVYVLCITVEDERSVAKPVYVNGENLRILESVEVQRFLGYKQIEHLRIPERSFDQDALVKKEIKDRLEQWISCQKINTIFIPNHFDMNPDHRTVCNICLDMIQEYLPKRANDLKNIYLYEVWGPTQATHYYSLSGEQYQHKRHAMQLYKTQMETVDYCKIIDEISNSRNVSYRDLLKEADNELIPNKEFFERIEPNRVSNYLTFKRSKYAY